MEYVEMREFLKEQNTTHEEMQMMWDFCIANNHFLISRLNAYGKTWTDLNVDALSTLKREYTKLKEEINNKN